MLGAVRLGDFVVSTCHPKPSGPFITASRSSFVDGRGQCTVGSRAVPGLCLTGSSSVFVDGKPATHRASTVVCGRITTCSNTVFISP